MAVFKINEKTEKTALVGPDLYLLGDSEDLSGLDYKLKRTQISSLVTYMQGALNFTGASIKYLTNADSPFTIADGDGFGTFICDTSGGDIDINAPTLADNQNRPLDFIHQVGGNLLTIDGEGAETIDGLTTIELPNQLDRVSVLGTTSEWAITEEKISCQIRLDTYAGHGSTDTKIMRFTNISAGENYGNIFSENHSTGYNGNTEGLEITVNKNGIYGFSTSVVAASSIKGLSINAPSLTTNVYLLSEANILAQQAAANYGALSWQGYLKKDDVIRPQGDGAAATLAVFTASYLGN